MPVYDRAAQFSPFAALTGYEAAVAETGRLTDRKAGFGRRRKRVNQRAAESHSGKLGQEAEISVTYFVPDRKEQAVNMSPPPE